MLIKNSEDLKKHLGSTSANFDIEEILPYVEQAELKFIRTNYGIGEELYAELDEAYQSDNLSDDQIILMSRLQKSIAYYAFLEALPFIVVSYGNGGIAEIQNQNGGQIRQWTYNNLEVTTCKNADIFLDKTLEYLERNADDFPVWKNSQAYTISNELFINSSAEMSRYMLMDQSRRAFLVLRNFIKVAEERHIVPSIGLELYESVKNEIVTDTDNINGSKLILVEKIRKALGQFTLIEALPFVPVQFTNSGLYILNSNDSIISKLSVSTEEITMSSIFKKAKSNAENFLGDLKQFLHKNHADFPLYPYEIEGATKPVEVKDNSNSPSFWL